MDASRERLLRDVMAAEFALIELNLYLNTHPCDCRALMVFICIAQRAKQLREQYERLYGPLTAAASVTYPWPWINSPWPWEMQ